LRGEGQYEHWMCSGNRLLIFRVGYLETDCKMKKKSRKPLSSRSIDL
jgi:hypothetical protein